MGNRAKAKFSNAGDMFFNGTRGGYSVPFSPGLPELKTVFAASLWLGGTDESGEPRFAVNIYSTCRGNCCTGSISAGRTPTSCYRPPCPPAPTG
ncbi:MAG: hypothetical protein J5I98_13705 [Phaeodactylibacter sp.]|nr:hypothetical protein [Phaeodactylibacter sp.]